MVSVTAAQVGRASARRRSSPLLLTSLHLTTAVLFKSLIPQTNVFKVLQQRMTTVLSLMVLLCFLPLSDSVQSSAAACVSAVVHTDVLHPPPPSHTHTNLVPQHDLVLHVLHLCAALICLTWQPAQLHSSDCGCCLCSPFQFAWTHVTLLIVVTQSHLVIQNLFEGMIW